MANLHPRHMWETDKYEWLDSQVQIRVRKENFMLWATTMFCVGGCYDYDLIGYEMLEMYLQIYELQKCVDLDRFFENLLYWVYATICGITPSYDYRCCNRNALKKSTVSQNIRQLSNIYRQGTSKQIFTTEYETTTFMSFSYQHKMFKEIVKVPTNLCSSLQRFRKSNIQMPSSK